MRIAQIAPLIERVPPKKYGGTERVVHALTEELVRRGHEVTLFATGDSVTSARLVSVYPRALREARIANLYGPNALSLLNIGVAYGRQEDFDIIHDHVGYLSLPTANVATTPVVMTMHGAFTSENRRIFETLNMPSIATISKAQVTPYLRINHLGTVYNGLMMEQYPFSAEHDGYLLCVGRIALEKGFHYAIEVAQYLDLPLIIAAKLDAKDLRYFREYIGPRLSEKIRWVGEVDEEERNRLMSRALCLLHPITWPEPFGLTMIEAMACGCPVIAFDRGSVPEIVIHGKTGFAARNIEQMIDGVTELDTINRMECRQHALENFTVRQMADGYEALYRNLLGGFSGDNGS
ncbi:MAG: glycosyltransferase family 4 protein [bacterium]|nr:glycosyltransferase family 4 protein [bacterium]MDZ4295749.1 glycosyltransferase family 4 protein [Patescibacteria group bacterium]